MKFIANECVYRATVLFLRQLGYDIVDVRDLKLVGCDDAVILTKAIKENRIIITFDKDFSDLRYFPLSKHSGIIWLKSKQLDVSLANQLLKDLLEKYRYEQIKGFLVVVTRRKVRFKKI